MLRRVSKHVYIHVCGLPLWKYRPEADKVPTLSSFQQALQIRR